MILIRFRYVHLFPQSAFLFGDRPTSCVNSDGKKPPPWVSFSKFGGSKTATNEQSVKGFKSLQEPGKDDGRPDQFAEQRKQALQQLVKESSGAKVSLICIIAVIF